MTPMIVRDTPWLRCGVKPSASMRSITCWINSGVGCGFNTMIIGVLRKLPASETRSRVYRPNGGSPTDFDGRTKEFNERRRPGEGERGSVLGVTGGLPGPA